MNAPRSISERALKALRWNYLGTAGRIAAQFVSQIILARLLGPEPTGLFAYAFLVVALCALFLEMGLGAGLVQSRQLSDQEIGTACGRLLFMGGVSSLTIYAFADVIADVVFSTPEAGKLIRAMAPALLISAAAFPASALLRRDLEFKIIQVAELASYVFGYLIVGVTAAYFGMGVWSLVFAWYAQSASSCLAMYVFAPRPPTPGNPLRSLSITRFGVVIMVTNLLNWAIDNGTHVAVGRFFGPAALGQFALSNNLVRTPANHLVVNLQSVLFPMAARAQDNDAGLRRAYLTALAGVGLIAFPTFAFVAIMAKPIVLLLLGPKWAEAALVLTPLAAAMIPHAAMALCGPVLNGRGQPEVELRLQALTLALMLVVLAVTSQWSLAAMAWGLALVYLCRCIWMTSVLMRRLQISLRGLGQALQGPALLASLAAVVALGVEPALHAIGAAAPASLVLEIAVACTIVIAALTVTTAPLLVLGPQMLWMVDKFLTSRPFVASLPGLRRIARLAHQAAG